MQAERDLICRVLQSHRLQQVVAAGITPEHFHTYEPEWRYILSMWQRHSEVPTVDLFRDKFPDFQYRKITGEDPSVNPAVEAVRSNHLELQMTDVAERFIKRLGARDSTPEETLDQIAQELDSLRLVETQGEEQIDIIADIAADVAEFERLQVGVMEGRNIFIPSPWEALNDRWGGFRPGELYGVVARMGEGKSFTMQQMTAPPLLDGYRVYFDPLEMGRFEVAMRMHTLLSWHMAKRMSPKHVRLPELVNRKNLEDLVTGRSVWSNRALMQGDNAIDIAEYKQWADAVKVAASSGFVTPLRSANSAPTTYATFARQVEKAEPHIAVLDYLTLLSDSPGRRSDWEMWRDITRDLKLLAMKLQIPIVVAVQANRNAAYGSTPELQDIAFSDAFGMNADRIISLKQHPNNEIAITCIKNRAGENRFRFWCHWFPDLGIIEQIKGRDVEDDFGG